MTRSIPAGRGPQPASGIRQVLGRWGGAVLTMAAIFALSSRPASALPDLGWADTIVKKGSHAVGYGLLALTYWRGFEWAPRRARLAWLMAAVYAVSDELHQSIVPGRHASVADVLVYDAGGAALALWLRARIRARHAGPMRGD